MWGRALGIMFVLPYSYFLSKGYITLRLGLRLSVLFGLGAGQGLIGWWMVKSGLEVGNIKKIISLFQVQLTASGGF
jgi:cytochrome c oxidase assembly protein subunit 15